MLSAKHIAIIIIISLSVGYFITHLSQIQKPDNTPYYNDTISPYLSKCSLTQPPDYRAPLKIYLACVSDKAFGNPRVITLMFSASLIPMTYLLARRIIGGYSFPVLATAMFCSSGIFEYYVNQVGFEQSWSLLFLASMLASFSRPILTGPLLVVSLFSKGLPIFCVPFVMYILHNSNVKNKKYAYAGIIGAVIFSIIFTMMFGTYLFQKEFITFHPELFSYAVKNLIDVFRHDILQVVLFGISATYLIISKDKLSKPLLFFIAGYYSTVILFPVFTVYAQFDYRMIPMIVMDSIISIMALRDIRIISMIMESTPLVLSKAVEIVHVKFYKS